jgi:hypothetical protein
LGKVHGPNLLKALLNELVGPGDNFDKVRHSKFLTEWLIEHDPEHLRELADYVSAVVDSTRS